MTPTQFGNPVGQMVGGVSVHHGYAGDEGAQATGRDQGGGQHEQASGAPGVYPDSGASGGGLSGVRAA